MMRRHPRPAVLALFLLVAGCGQKDEAADPQPQDFALSLKVEASGAQVSRLDLPAAALVAIQRADKGDIRILDAQGRTLSTAFIEPGAAQQERIHLNAIPFGGKAVEGHAPISVRVEQKGGSVSVHAEGEEARDPERSVLFDTRAIKGTAISLALETDLPKQRPVTIYLAAGGDLKGWEPLVERVLFRPGEGPDVLGGNRIALPPVELRGRYLRAAWQGGPPLNVTGATLVTSTTPPPPRVMIPAAGLALADSHTVAFSLPPGSMPLALRVAMTGRDGVVPVRLLGRDAAEAPWTPLAIASLKQGGAGATLDLHEGPAHFLKLQADSRSGGFSQVPSVTFEYAPVALAVAFNGNGPYRLLVGNAAAQPSTFALSDLTSQTGPFATARIIGAQTGVTIMARDDATMSRTSPRVVALWVALLAGVAVLAYAAFRLLRANNAGAGDPG
jgi:hypothetical protein